MIKVLIVDDIPETRDHLSRLLGLEREIDVAGTASSGEEAIQVAMDMRPTSSSWTSTCRAWTAWPPRRSSPSGCRNSPIIMMSVHGEAEHLKRAMLAGAREFLVKPFSGDEFATSIKRVYERELVRREQMQATRDAGGAPAAGRTESAEDHQVIAVFSPKGGAGRTTIATNLALALAARDGPARGPGRRQPPVRRRRRPAQPEPEEPVRCSTRSRAASRIATSSSRSWSTTRPGSGSCSRRRRPRAPTSSRRLPAQDGRHACARPTTGSSSTCRPASTTTRSASSTRPTRSWSSPRSRSRPSRTCASSWRSPTSSTTSARRCGSSSTAPTPRRASASATWRPPSADRSTARSSRTAGWPCSQ